MFTMTPAGTTLSDVTQLMISGAAQDEAARAARQNEFLKMQQQRQQAQDSEQRNAILHNQLVQQGEIAARPYDRMTAAQAAELDLQKRALDASAGLGIYRNPKIAEDAFLQSQRAQEAANRANGLLGQTKMELVPAFTQSADTGEFNGGSGMWNNWFSSQAPDAAKAWAFGAETPAHATDPHYKALKKAYDQKLLGTVAAKLGPDAGLVEWDEASGRFKPSRSALMPGVPQGANAPVPGNQFVTPPTASAPVTATAQGVPILGGPSMSPWQMPDQRVVDAFAGSQFTAPPAANRYRIVGTP